LDPVEIEIMIQDHRPSGARLFRSEGETISELLNHLQILIPVMAANMVLHNYGESSLKVEYGCHVTDRARMEDDTRQTLKSNGNLPEEFSEKLTSFSDSIEKFTADHAENSKDLFESLCRIIDGKRVFNRLQRNYTLRDEYRFYLARRIREKERIPHEIESLIQSLLDS
jgi:pyruvate-formate lyase-activating enzyme